MLPAADLLADTLTQIGESTSRVTVRLSNELVQLLSEQLYQSPLKAIEELVVNSFDADAKNCYVYVPNPSQVSGQYIAVFDDGSGMDEDGLTNLWQIGRSNKRAEEIAKRAARKRIGKFGIGKLATYTIAERLTFISRTNDKILSVTLNYADFTSNPENNGDPINLDLREITEWSQFANNSLLTEICTALGITVTDLFEDEMPSWTLVLLENLKEKAEKIKHGILTWVLSTAMPLGVNFKLFLNGKPIISSKEGMAFVVEYSIADLSKEKLDALAKKTGESWTVRDNALYSPSFESGISGEVRMVGPRETLYGGKSSDLIRNHGFFVRVRERLINEQDPLFGLSPLSFKYFYRLRVDITANDLDAVITAPREGVEDSNLTAIFQELLSTIFYDSEAKYDAYEEEMNKQNDRMNEGHRQYVAPQLFEYPTADALVSISGSLKGAEADETWFYLDIQPETDVQALIQRLYTSERAKYSYQQVNLGQSSRMVKYDPLNATFTLNMDHPFVINYYGEGKSKFLLEDMAVAEALLEVYLRESQVPLNIIGGILQRRDTLLRGLANDHRISLSSIAKALRDSSANERDLEIELVAAARALGFVANHLSNGGNPDGMAYFNGYSSGQRTITLEAKSSQGIPSLTALAFDGLYEHVVNNNADGCLLVAPGYPGDLEEGEVAVDRRARNHRISCWTVDLLADFVEAAEKRHLTAQHLLSIVLNVFAPDDVKEAVEEILTTPTWQKRDLYQAILAVLKEQERALQGTARNVSMVAAWITAKPGFENVPFDDISNAVSEIAAASQGAMAIRDAHTIVINTSIEELVRRVTGSTGLPGEARRQSSFHG